MLTTRRARAGDGSDGGDTDDATICVPVRYVHCGAEALRLCDRGAGSAHVLGRLNIEDERQIMTSVLNTVRNIVWLGRPPKMPNLRELASRREKPLCVSSPPLPAPLPPLLTEHQPTTPGGSSSFAKNTPSRRRGLRARHTQLPAQPPSGDPVTLTRRRLPDSTARVRRPGVTRRRGLRGLTRLTAGLHAE